MLKLTDNTIGKTIRGIASIQICLTQNAFNFTLLSIPRSFCKQRGNYGVHPELYVLLATFP